MYQILIIILFLGLSSTPAFADEEDKNLISVTGESKIYVEPDEVNVSMTVEIRGKNLEEAQRQNDEITDKILRLATTKLSIEEKDIQTNFINVRPVYEYPMCGNQQCPTPQFSYFETQKGILIVVKDTSKLQELLTRAIEAGVTRIDSVQFSSSKFEQLRDKAQVDASLDAKRKAGEIANALGVTLGHPHRIDVQQYSSFSPYPKMEMMATRSLAMDGSSAQTIALGQLLITANVNASFEIAN